MPDNNINYSQSWVESEVVSFFLFSHIRIMGYLRLGYERVKECSTELDPSAGTRNRRKATVKIPNSLNVEFYQ